MFCVVIVMIDYEFVVSKWLKKVAEANNFKTYEYIGGTFDFQNNIIKQSSGSVYGIWIATDESSREEIKQATADFNNKGGPDGFAPLYWGKDISPGSRIKGHFKTSKGTGGLNLYKSKYVNCHMIYGVILVENYLSFEKLLHNKYRPLIGSSLNGRCSSLTKIEH